MKTLRPFDFTDEELFQVCEAIRYLGIHKVMLPNLPIKIERTVKKTKLPNHDLSKFGWNIANQFEIPTGEIMVFLSPYKELPNRGQLLGHVNRLLHSEAAIKVRTVHVAKQKDDLNSLKYRIINNCQEYCPLTEVSLMASPPSPRQPYYIA